MTVHAPMRPHVRHCYVSTVHAGRSQGLRHAPPSAAPPQWRVKVKHGALALHEPQAPVGRHDWAANNAGELIEDVHGARAQEEVEVQDTANCSELQRVAGEDDLHAVAIHEHHSVCQAACRDTGLLVPSLGYACMPRTQGVMPAVPVKGRRQEMVLSV